MQTAKCLSCRSDIVVDDEAVIGDLADCLVCNAQHEITSLTPVTLSLLSEGESNEDESESNEPAEEEKED